MNLVRQAIAPHPELSIRQQCRLLGVNRSSLYYEPAGDSKLNLELMGRIDEVFTQRPFLGSRKLTERLKADGYEVNRKRVQRLMRKMGICAVYPKPRTSKAAPNHRIYPYLLRDIVVTEVNQVWCSDITYIGLRRGYLYLVAVMDWFSRYVLSWQLSNTLEEFFCVSALENALMSGKPMIFNTDQGSQFTGRGFTGTLDAAGVRISMDGRGRWMDNVFIERLWRSLKYEEVYLKDYDSVVEVEEGLGDWFEFYNNERQHQGLSYKTPAQVYREGRDRSEK